VPRTLLTNILAYGSKNGILDGFGFIRLFAGFPQIDYAEKKGSIQLFQADNSFAGLGDEAGTGKGSVFKVQRVLVVVGTGALRVKGLDLGVSADSTLRYLKKEAGEFAAPMLPAGQARPSSQTIYPKDTPGSGHTAMDGSVVTCIWRIDETTGQVSLASLASNVLALSQQTVIQQFPATDTAQGKWGIGVVKPGFGSDGVLYELKTELGGEVDEETLSYTREVTGASIADGTNVVDITDPDAGDQFTASDVGRRISFDTFDSWITEVVSEVQVLVDEENTSGGAIAGDATVTHAVNGILRAVEISWTSESLVGQDLVPFDAYTPPSNIIFAGIINDTMFLETSDGIIYVGVPGYIGSYPPKNTLFPSEAATCFLDGADGLYWRFTRTTFTVLTYTGGNSPIELQLVWKNHGVIYPQNAAVGIGGRVIAWSGKPVRLQAGSEPETAFAERVYKDFEGWDSSQTSEKPIITTSDPQNMLDIWAFDQKIMCLKVPKDDWCTPIDLSGKLAEGEYLTGAVVVDNRVMFATNAGSEIRLYEFDEQDDESWTLVVKTADIDSPLQSDTITGIAATVHFDSQATAISVKVVTDFDDDNPVDVETRAPLAPPENQILRFRDNILNAKAHAVQVEIESTSKNAGVQRVETWGESSDIFID
jgi:hypothetical protein